jgi:hypothetical protein
VIDEKRLDELSAEAIFEDGSLLTELIRLARLGLKYEQWINEGRKRLSETGKELFSKTHGLSSSRVFKIWASMIARCNYPSASGYERYGGRGIKVCEKWQDFLGFFEDMGHPPNRKSSLDRIDNDKGYDLANCRWVDLGEQAKNTRRAIMVEVNGKRMCMKDAAKALNLPYDKLKRYFKKHGSLAKALAALPKEEE